MFSSYMYHEDIPMELFGVTRQQFQTEAMKIKELLLSKGAKSEPVCTV